ASEAPTCCEVGADQGVTHGKEKRALASHQLGSHDPLVGGAGTGPRRGKLSPYRLVRLLKDLKHVRCCLAQTCMFWQPAESSLHQITQRARSEQGPACRGRDLHTQGRDGPKVGGANGEGIVGDNVKERAARVPTLR